MPNRLRRRHDERATNAKHHLHTISRSPPVRVWLCLKSLTQPTFGFTLCFYLSFLLPLKILSEDCPFALLLCCPLTPRLTAIHPCVYRHVLETPENHLPLKASSKLRVAAFEAVPIHTTHSLPLSPHCHSFGAGVLNRLHVSVPDPRVYPVLRQEWCEGPIRLLLLTRL